MTAPLARLEPVMDDRLEIPTKTAPLPHLASAARARLTAAPANSPVRKAAGCALVVLKEAKTVKGALRMLAASTLPDGIRDQAADLIHQLAEQHTASQSTKETTR